MKTRNIITYLGTAVLVAGFLLLPADSSADSLTSVGLLSQDPMVKICSLPIDRDLSEVLAGISEDVSNDTGIGEEFITYYWVTLSDIICMGDTVNTPILVDLYVPGFFNNDDMISMMNSLAAAIETNVGLDREWIFIQIHYPSQGQVYLSGEVQVWDDYQGPANAEEYTD
jgi:hypothetical protein